MRDGLREPIGYVFPAITMPKHPREMRVERNGNRDPHRGLGKL